MTELGRLELIEVKRLFVRGTIQRAGWLVEDSGSLLIRPAIDRRGDLLAVRGWHVVRLAYSTDRFEPRACELGRRADRRPFEHVFTRRPQLEWDAEREVFVMPGVEMTRNQIGEPLMIAS